MPDIVPIVLPTVQLTSNASLLFFSLFFDNYACSEEAYNFQAYNNIYAYEDNENIKKSVLGNNTVNPLFYFSPEGEAIPDQKMDQIFLPVWQTSVSTRLCQRRCNKY